MEIDLENDLFSKGLGFEVANPRDRWSFTMNRRITLILEVRGWGWGRVPNPRKACSATACTSHELYPQRSG